MKDKIKGCLYGLSIGDAIGLRYETFKPSEINDKNIGKVCLGGIISDDTEHMILITRSLLKYKNVDKFKKSFIRSLQLWFSTLPINIGKTTGKSIIKSFFTSNCGAKGSGNGSVMRIAPIGLIYRDDESKIKEFSDVSCRITHNDTECSVNSTAIAILIAEILNNNWNQKNKPSIESLQFLLNSVSNDDFWKVTVDEIISSLNNNIEPMDLVNNWTKGAGAVGYTKFSTIISIICWYKYYGDYEKTITEIIKLGGDTDTNAAIAGALAGSTVGFSNLPTKWISKIKDMVVSKSDINNASESIILNKNNIKIWKFIAFGLIKNIISIIYFITASIKRLIYNILKIKF
jgi:ADP-ribosyl-[dinitrogen reductase] hydrolase